MNLRSGMRDDAWRGTPELSALLAAARKKLESNWLEVTGGITVRLDNAPELWRLCSEISRSTSGLHSRAHTARLDLPKFDEWLSSPLGGGIGLRETLEQSAPLVDKRRRDADRSKARADALTQVHELIPDRADEEWAVHWKASLLGQDGLLAGRISIEPLLAAAHVLACLPVDGLSLTELGESAVGDAKVLAGGPVPRMVLDALSLREGVRRPVDPVGVRQLWATAGVSVDPLSSHVFVLNFRVAEKNIVSRWLDDAADGGIPFPVTMDMLSRGDLTTTAARVFVCENVAVLAAVAKTLGSKCPPLVCTDGQPSTAAHRLLSQSVTVGSVLLWRNNFDWPGLRTTERARQRYRAVPWRMTSEDYRRGLDARNSESLKGPPAPSEWDRDLQLAMIESGRAVLEERLIHDLVTDLRGDESDSAHIG